MLQKNPQVGAEDNSGRTPLELASFGGHLNIVTELLDAGADIDHQDHAGTCSLHWAVKCGHVDLVRILVDRGAYLNNVSRMSENGVVSQVEQVETLKFYKHNFLLLKPFKAKNW